MVALGEHSTTYIASHLEDPRVQYYLRLLLDYTGYPGWYGEDEEESEVSPRCIFISILSLMFGTDDFAIMVSA